MKEQVIHERRRGDFYPTPKWATRLFLDSCPLVADLVADPEALVLEPSAGWGGIADFIPDRRRVLCLENDPYAFWVLRQKGYRTGLVDFRTWHPLLMANPFWPDLTIGNPPFSECLAHVQKAIEVSPVSAFMLPLNFLATKRRKDFVNAHHPDVYIHSSRPSFAHGQGGKSEYAWYVFHADSTGTYLSI